MAIERERSIEQFDEAHYLIAFFSEGVSNENARAVLREFRAIRDRTQQVREFLRGSLGRISATDKARLATTVSEFSILFRLAAELPSADQYQDEHPDTCDRVSAALTGLAEELWERAEQADMETATNWRLGIQEEVIIQKDGRASLVNLRADVWDKSNGHCWYCGVLIHPFRNFHIDHVIPVADGGPDDLANLVPACQLCNSRKSARHAEYLRRFIAGGVFWFERERKS